MSNPNEIAAQLKVVWEADITLFDRIRHIDFLSSTNDDRENLPRLLEELTQQSSTSRRLQRELNQFDLTLENDLAELKAKRNESLSQAMEIVQRTKDKALAGKHETLIQLAAVNQARAGYDRYSKR